MANQITSIRNRVALLFGAVTVLAATLLFLAFPAFSDLAPDAIRLLRINCVVFGIVVLVAAIALIQHYMRPISDLGYALEIGSTPAVDLARDARRIALNAPAYLFILSTGGVVFVSLIYNLVRAALLQRPVFVVHVLPMALTVAVTACGSLLAALVCQRWMYPVLRYTATRFQSGALRITVRARIYAVMFSLVVLTVLLPGSYAIVQAIDAYRADQAAAWLRVLDTAIEHLPSGGSPAQLLAGAEETIPRSMSFRHLFLVDAEGTVLATQGAGGVLAFDGAAWAEEKPDTFRYGEADHALARLPGTAQSPWLGVSYVLHPLGAPAVRRLAIAVGGSGLVLVAMALLLGHHLASSLTGALEDVSQGLRRAAQARPLELGAALPVLSADRVGDLVLAYNELQGRVRDQVEQIEHEQRQLSAIQSLSYKIGTVRNPVHLLEEVIRDVERAFGYHNVSILLADERAQELHFAATQLENESLRRRRFRVGTDGVVGHVAATREPLLVNDVSACAFYIPDGTNTRSELAVPLVMGDRLLGVFNVSSERTGAFEESDLRVVMALANQLSIALENAHLRDEVVATVEARDWQARNQTILNDISSALSASLNQHDLLAMVAERLVALFAVDYGAVVLVDADLSVGRVVATQPPQDSVPRAVPVADGILAEALHAGRPVAYAERAGRDLVAAFRDALHANGVRAVLVAPLAVAGRVGGLIVLGAADPLRTFAEDELAVCQTIAAQVAVGVENARLLAGLQGARDRRATMGTAATGQRIRLDAVLSSLPDGVLVTDLGGRVLLCNPAFRALSGLSVDEVLGALLSEALPALPLHDLVVQVSSTGEEQARRVRFPGGPLVVVRATLVHETEAPAGVVLVFREAPE
jgi:PAS domain S-box-containing protein